MMVSHNTEQRGYIVGKYICQSYKQKVNIWELIVGTQTVDIKKYLIFRIGDHFLYNYEIKN